MTSWHRTSPNGRYRNTGSPILLLRTQNLRLPVSARRPRLLIKSLRSTHSVLISCLTHCWLWRSPTSLCRETPSASRLPRPVPYHTTLPHAKKKRKEKKEDTSNQRHVLQGSQETCRLRRQRLPGLAHLPACCLARMGCRLHQVSMFWSFLPIHSAHPHPLTTYPTPC